MALLENWLNDPKTILGLSLIANQNQPAQGLLKGALLNNQLKKQRSDLTGAGLQQQLYEQQLLRAKQEADMDRRRAAYWGTMGNELTGPVQPGMERGYAGGSGILADRQITPQELAGAAAFENSPFNAYVQALNAQKEGGGVSVEINNAEPYSLTDLLKLRDKKTGGHPQPGTAPQDILGETLPNGENRYEVVSPKDLERSQNVSTALGIVKQMRELAFPTEGQQPLFQKYEGIPGRVEQGIKNVIEEQGQTTERGKRLRLYNNSADGFLSMMARTFGERGTLTNQDIARARKLIAQASYWPDNPDVAKQQFDLLENLIKEIDARKPGSGNEVKQIGDTYFMKNPDGTWETVD